MEIKSGRLWRVHFFYCLLVYLIEQAHILLSQGGVKWNYRMY